MVTDGAPSKAINFVILYIPEVDAIFNDFQEALNPFVENRIALENAQKSFKAAVQSIEKIHPKAAFRDYVRALKTSLSQSGVWAKIDQGAVRFQGEVARITDAEKKCVEAVEQILSTAEKLYDMVPRITGASEDAVRRAENLDVKAIVQRECSGIKESLKTSKKFKDNLKMMKKAPKMVTDFCKEVEKIVEELKKGLSAATEEEHQGSGSGQEQRKGSKGRAEARKEPDEKAEKRNEENGRKDEEDGKNKAKKDGKEKGNDEKSKKGNFHKKLSFEKIGLPDIDQLFINFASTINPFVTSREKMQKAREKFEAVFKMISEFDGEKEFKAYLKELKKKAEQGGIHIYVEVVDDTRIEVKSITGVPVPKPFRDVIECLNAVNSCAIQLLDLEPEIQRGIELVLNDILNIKPESDLRRVLKLRELPKLPGKIKKFNNNRKTAQEAPEVVSDFFKYIKQIIADIKDFIQEEK